MSEIISENCSEHYNHCQNHSETIPAVCVSVIFKVIHFTSLSSSFLPSFPLLVLVILCDFFLEVLFPPSSICFLSLVLFIYHLIICSLTPPSFILCLISLLLEFHPSTISVLSSISLPVLFSSNSLSPSVLP